MKKWLTYGTVVCVAVVTLFISCSKDNPIPPAINYGYNYYPNTMKYFVIYNVDSTVRNELKTPENNTYIYQIKEEIDSFYTDGSGRPTQRIVRYKRIPPSTTWVVEKVWSANLTKTDAERVEDNIRYVRLIFPVKLNVSWNGNAYNTLNFNDQQSYQYTSVDNQFTIGSHVFDSTLIVVEDSFQSAYSHRFYMERYARNVGRIFREQMDLSYPGIIYDAYASTELNSIYLGLTDTLLSHMGTGSYLYTETYDSAGYDH